MFFFVCFLWLRSREYSMLTIYRLPRPLPSDAPGTKPATSLSKSGIYLSFSFGLPYAAKTQQFRLILAKSTDTVK